MLREKHVTAERLRIEQIELGSSPPTALSVGVFGTGQSGPLEILNITA